MKKFLRISALLLTLVNITTIHAKADSHKLAALTFDDGPHAVYTAELLDGLKERGVNVTFFFLGQCAAENPELVRRAYEEGHEIGSHTWSHPDLKKLSDEKIRSQLDRCRNLFSDLLGEERYIGAVVLFGITGILSLGGMLCPDQAASDTGQNRDVSKAVGNHYFLSFCKVLSGYALTACALKRQQRVILSSLLYKK